jgi:hypothetical protein|tara:strand:- start:995 stop:1303 length:309 start_codon:yes stop_codon:yes gene_type:complete
MSQPQQISEQSKVTLDLKTMGLIVGFTISLATTYFSLKSEIILAKELPRPEITALEFSYKDELIRSSLEKAILQVNNIENDVNEIKESLAKMDERLYEISTK